MAENCRALVEILLILNTLWNHSIPEWITEKIKKTDYDANIAEFIRFLRYPGSYKREEQPGSPFKPLKNIPGIFNKMLFLTGYLFPSKEYMTYKYGNKTRKELFIDYPLRLKKIVKSLYERNRLKQ